MTEPNWLEMTHSMLHSWAAKLWRDRNRYRAIAESLRDDGMGPVSLEDLEWLVLECLDAERITLSRAAELLCVPVAEMRERVNGGRG